MTSATNSVWIAMMDHMFNFWSHCHSPEEFLNWICTCSESLRRCSIRFPDDWWTRFIGSQLLYSLRDNCITPWGNWLLCYGMHQGELSDLPGAPKPFANSDQICCPDEKSDDSSVITGNDFHAPISPRCLASRSITTGIITNPGPVSTSEWKGEILKHCGQ